MPVTRQTSGLEKLRNSFVQPGRTPARRDFIHERMHQLVLQHSSQLRVHRRQAAHWNAQLSVIERSHPARRVRHIEELCFCVEGYQNVVPRRTAEILDQFVVIGFESSQYLLAKGLRALMSFIVQHKMAALVLRELRLRGLLSPGLL